MKYAEDVEYRGRLIEQGKKKYAEDDEYRCRLLVWQCLRIGSWRFLSATTSKQPDTSVIDPWNGTFIHVELTAIMRQKDDKSFAELPNRIRVSGKKRKPPPRSLGNSSVMLPVSCVMSYTSMINTAPPVLLEAEGIVKDPKTGEQKEERRHTKDRRPAG